MIKSAWNAAVNWFERGDLIPLLVLVSAVHYANILAAYDWWGVAVAIGLLVDLGHYRVIRAAVRYSGSNGWESLARWVIAAIMTAVSLSYHQRFYSDWWLSIPLPLLIAALAWLQRVDKSALAKPSETPAKVSGLQSALAKPSEPQSEPLAKSSEMKSAKCETCGFTANNQNALNAHKRIHKE